MEFKILLRSDRVCLARYNLDRDEYDGERAIQYGNGMTVDRWAHEFAEFTGLDLIDCR